ncbi:infection structure specific [Fusarium longipes]|uniref:Infection structure specific n=1 Tax=Fusarium longipes TaxID=694270 RepID=A0A395SVC5_9HYPO|nr:infection structure specific [Fusarium longipes]
MQSILIASLLATAVSANVNFMAHPIMKRGALEARQTGLPSLGDISEECQSAVLDLAQGIPTPAPEIVSDLLENPQTDPCSFSTPASLSSEYGAYSSSILSWYGKNQDGIMSAVKECPELAQFASLVPICEATATAIATKEATSAASAASTSGVVPPVNSSAADETVKTPVATPTSGESTPVETNGAVAREGGLLYIAAAAVAGVVAAL